MRSCEIEGKEVMHEAILNRDRKRALITVSNHTAGIDDPFVTALLVPDEALLPPPPSPFQREESEGLKQKLEIDGVSHAEQVDEATDDDDAVHQNRVRWVMCAT